MSCYDNPQLQVGANYPYLFNFRPNICKYWFLKTYFIPNSDKFSFSMPNHDHLITIFIICTNIFYKYNGFKDLFSITTIFFVYQLNHLEESNASMAEDLLMKTAIIEHYVMDSKTGKFLTFSIVFPLYNYWSLRMSLLIQIRLVWRCDIFLIYLYICIKWYLLEIYKCIFRALAGNISVPGTVKFTEGDGLCNGQQWWDITWYQPQTTPHAWRNSH